MPGADPVGGCVFCAIVAGTMPADVVATNELAIAFRDHDPVAPTHVLVIPRRHVRDAAQLGAADAELLASMFGLARRVAEADGILGGGYRIVVNTGRDAQNSVPHLHVHVLGGRRFTWPPG